MKTNENYWKWISSCSKSSAPHSAFASARLMALRRLVAERALFFHHVPFFQMCGSHPWQVFSSCYTFPDVRAGPRMNGPIFPTSESRAVAVRVKMLNFALCETHCQHSNYRTFPSGICKRTFPSKGWWGWESVWEFGMLRWIPLLSAN